VNGYGNARGHGNGRAYPLHLFLNEDVPGYHARIFALLMSLNAREVSAKTER